MFISRRKFVFGIYNHNNNINIMNPNLIRIPELNARNAIGR